MNICIIRHGETDWNRSRRLQGREDVPLNQTGLSQAKECGLALSKIKWDVIVTSPLLRAKQTAERIADLLDIPEIQVEMDLMERDYGKASGLTYEERNALYPNALHPNGECEGMEDWNTLRDRVMRALLNHIHANMGKNLIVISHGGVINSILAELSDHTIGTGKTRLRNACLNMLTYSNQGLKIVFYNKQAHEVDFSRLGDFRSTFDNPR